MNEAIITIKADENTLAQIRDFYRPFLIDGQGAYVLFQAKHKDVIVTAYTNTKGKPSKVTFAGSGNVREARRFDSSVAAPLSSSDSEGPLGWFDIDDQIGSDEVGTGDFFGPITVCAALVRKEDVASLKEMGICDSKKMSDEYIMQITPRLLRRFAYSQVSLSNEKFNSLVRRGLNMNEIKARLHNRVLLNLMKKHGDITNVYVDKFVSEEKYFLYAANDPEIVKNIVFKTKGESRYPSVALASVIARYSFLIKMRALSEKYRARIPFGASAKVDAFATSFLRKYGLEEFEKVTKVNFENYRRVVNEEIIR